MNSDLFNVAIIVLVVLAQLGGAIFAAWKKRQAAREAELRRGGLVVVQDGGSSSNQTPARASRSSWDAEDDEEDDPFAEQSAPSESDENTEEEWDEHEPGELDQAPVEARPSYGYSVQVQPARFSASVPAESGTPALHHLPLPVPNRSRGPSRARDLLGGNKLRQVVLAQTILNPSPLARRLRR